MASCSFFDGGAICVLVCFETVEVYGTFHAKSDGLKNFDFLFS